MNKEWIEEISKLETYDISPYEINKSIIEFAKAILELANGMPKQTINIGAKEIKAPEEARQNKLDFE